MRGIAEKSQVCVKAERAVVFARYLNLMLYHSHANVGKATVTAGCNVYSIRLRHLVKAQALSIAEL